jgi:sugar lactone lactonase YvrE
MKVLKPIGTILALLILYLCFWPIDIDPVAWEPPVDSGLIGVYAPNTYLADVEIFGIGDGIGPEDIDIDSEGRIYAPYEGGRIVRYDADGKNPELFVDTGGRPLGLEFDAAGNLIICDAIKGLLAASPEGELSTILTEVAGIPLKFTDDVDIAKNGTIYFTDASSRWGIEDYRSDIVEHRPSGRLISFDPDKGIANVLLDGLYFANGVAISPDGEFILINETSEYRVQKYWLKGEKTGQSEILMDNLPGFPDGISSNGKGTYWIAMPALRKEIIDNLAGKPFVRKIILRLPEDLQPAPDHYGFIIGIDGDGNIIHNFQDPSPESFSPITSVEEHEGFLFLGSLTYEGFGRIKAPD